MKQHKCEATAAREEAWNAELGAIEEALIDARVRNALGSAGEWVLIGGPPCQAYSLVGRSRMRGVNPSKFEKDPRHFLYREYLRILAKHQPAVFVMENVKGLLSATHRGAGMFDRILADLREPARALRIGERTPLRYRLYAIGASPEASLVDDTQRTSDFVVRCEEHGVPQARHRIIILGVRDERQIPPGVGLGPSRSAVPLGDVINDLPPLRSMISRGRDSEDQWLAVLRDCVARLRREKAPAQLAAFLETVDLGRTRPAGTGGEFVRAEGKPRYTKPSYRDRQLQGVCNHSSRAHLPSDIQRYFFAAAFACASGGAGRSPVLADFPKFLLPDHGNVELALEGKMFSDRFRVQVANRPATTITSHIAKDGHYYIHPDPLQARSLTVREAARIQTFPDNYFFCGPRTSQYQQVGNAVPPFLAKQIAQIVYGVLEG